MIIIYSSQAILGRDMVDLSAQLRFDPISVHARIPDEMT
jgi:hypothetical protein